MPRFPDLPCASCGKLMWRGTTSLPEGEARCRPCRKAAKEAALQPTVEWSCQACGKRCERERVRGQRPKWCEECRRMGVRASWRTCAACSKQFIGSGAAYCSLSCRPQSRRKTTALVHVPDAPAFTWLPKQHPVMRTQRKRSEWWVLIVAGPCSWCGERFTATSTAGTERYCSKRCASRAYKLGSGRFAISARARLAIYERDAWTCQLCMEPVEASLMALDPLNDWAPSLDHIVPQSKGGTHGEDNLRLAHRWCNAVRGDDSYYTEADLRAA